MNTQHTSQHILMVRPASFGFNAQTAESNAFQQKPTQAAEEIQAKAVTEFDDFVAQLRALRIDVTVAQDSAEPTKPDAIFPNNWVSFHPDGQVFLFPMCTPNRRWERDPKIIQQIAESFDIKQINDLSATENQNMILEGTGSMVFDHINKIGYACLSPRTHKTLFENFCQKIGYQPISFTALDKSGGEIYHTNVVMCIGEGFVVICLESIPDKLEQKKIRNSFNKNEIEIIAISLDQMNNFAGNMLEVSNKNGKKYLIMSKTAYTSLNYTQQGIIRKYSEIVSVDIPTIESIGGGSARCMMAEIFCPKK
ncbi:MAG: citrulline utilization hydrolase CtlX [Cellulosilyticaceae bacterium]